MSDKQFKTLRKQLRNVVQEAVPAILTVELVDTVRKELKEHIDKQLETLANNIKMTLDRVEQRSIDTQNLIVRSSTPQAPVETTQEPAS